METCKSKSQGWDVSMAVGYGLTMAHIFGRFFAALPWATPPFLLGPWAPVTSRRPSSL